MKKLLAIVMVAAMTLSMCVMANAADDPGYTADVKNVNGVITVTVSATKTDKTDVAIVYDPDVYTCTGLAAAEAFEAKTGEKNDAGDKCFMFAEAPNKKATTDDGAATYAVYTSAVSQASPEMPAWDYSGEFAVFRFALVEGKTSADATDLTIVADSASNAKTADGLVASPLKKLAAADVKAILDATPEPSEPSDTTEPPTPGDDNTPEPGTPGDDNTPEPGTPGGTTPTNAPGGTTTPAPGGQTPAAKTADVAPVATMVTLVLMAGAVLVVLKKRAAE